MLFQSGAPGRNRTRDLRFTKPLLYQLSYKGCLKILAAPTVNNRRVGDLSLDALQSRSAAGRWRSGRWVGVRAWRVPASG